MRLSEELKARIREFRELSPEAIALKAKQFPNMPMAFIAQQVKARQRAKKKLPSWVANDNIAFPTTLSLEQCTSESAAKYKAELLSGTVMADLTGGFGVDAFTFSERFDRTYHIERDAELSNIVSENIDAFKRRGRIDAIVGDGLQWLSEYEGDLDLIYLDPARRDERSLKVSGLGACEPNVASCWPMLLRSSNQVAVKLSPGLDIDSIVKALPSILEVHVISIRNECKECFCLAELGFKGETKIVCANQRSDGEWDRFEFYRSAEKGLNGSYSSYLKYLYEPNASIMKAGGFKSLGADREIPLLHPRTRFYASNEFVEAFPGRVFEILEIGELRKQVARKFFPERKANVLARNIGLSSDGLRRKLELGDGGELFAIGTMDLSETRRLVKCRRAQR